MKKALLVVLMIALLSQQTASSFVPPAAGNWLFNRSIASIMREVAKRRGIAAADPRIAATEAAMSSQLTALNVAATGAGFGLTMLGAPVWLTVLAGLGIVVGGSALMAHMGNDKIQIREDGYGRVSVRVPKTQQPKVDKATYPGLRGSGFEEHWSVTVARAGFRVFRESGCTHSEPCSRFPLGSGMIGTDSDKVSIAVSSKTEVENLVMFISSLYDGRGAYKTFQLRPTYDMEGKFISYVSDATFDVVERVSRPCGPGDGKEKDCYTETIRSDGYTGQGFIHRAGWPRLYFRLDDLEAREAPTTAQNWYDSLERAYIGIPKDIHGARIGNETLAKVVDSAWRRAASVPGYEGVPYSTTAPVTTADVEPWAKANPDAVPRVEDLFRPASRPREREVVIRERIKTDTRTETETETKVDPTTGTKTETKTETDTKTQPESQLAKDVNVINRPTVDIGSPVKVDLGSVPNVANPTLEDPPTAAMILDPILKIVPGFKDWKTPKYKAQCPRPSFELFNKQIRMDAMCDLAEKYRPMITSIMLAVFVLIAATIVLAA